MTLTRRAVAAAVLAAVSGVGVVGCSSGHPATPASVSVSNGPVAVRWWSNGAAQVGSTIDASRPGALAGKLSPSRTQYCTMLRQTVASGTSILSGVGAADPARYTATVAFVSELQKVAPSEVASAWRVLGPEIETIVKSGALPTPNATAAAQAAAAAQTVGADATKNCGVDLAAAAKH